MLTLKINIIYSTVSVLHSSSQVLFTGNYIAIQYIFNFKAKAYKFIQSSLHVFFTET